MTFLTDFFPFLTDYEVQKSEEVLNSARMLFFRVKKKTEPL